jgi:hypothetical protein
MLSAKKEGIVIHCYHLFVSMLKEYQVAFIFAKSISSSDEIHFK